MTDITGSDRTGAIRARTRGDPEPIGGSLMSAAPALAFLGALFVVPLGFLLSFAFLTIERGDIVSGLPTLRHFFETLTDDLFWIVAWRSFWVGVVSTVLCVVFAYPVAWVYSELKGVWRPIVLVLVVAPLLTSAVVRTYAWIVILGGRYGLINSLLIDFGLIGRPLRILNTDIAVIIGMVQIHLPFMILPLISVLDGRDRAREEASLALGASRIVTFFRVTLPLSVPGIAAGASLVFALSYTNFIIPQLLGGGNYTTLALQVYEFIIVILDWTEGAVRATLLLLSCFAIVLLINKFGAWYTRWLEAGR